MPKNEMETIEGDGSAMLQTARGRCKITQSTESPRFSEHEDDLSPDEILHNALLTDPLRVSNAGPPSFDAGAASEAVEAFIDSGRYLDAAALAGSLSVFWQDVGDAGRGRGIAERVLAFEKGSDEGDEWCRVHMVVGELAFRQGDQEAALQHSQAALERALRHSFSQLAARASVNLARIAYRDGDADRILRHVAVAEEHVEDSPAQKARVEHMRAWGLYTAGRLEESITSFERSLELRRQAGDPGPVAMELLNLASLALEREQGEPARAWLREAIDAIPGVKSAYMKAGLLAVLAEFASFHGHHENALKLMSACRRLNEEAGLIPDPGDDKNFARITEVALKALGPEKAERSRAAGKQLDAEELWALARTTVSR
jgi:tetratricopeptide (TPR) repeat protein